TGKAMPVTVFSGNESAKSCACTTWASCSFSNAVHRVHSWYWTASSQAHSTHGLGFNKLLIPRHARVIALAAGDVAKRSMACKSELMDTVCRTPAKVGARVGVSVDISLDKTI